MSRLSKFLRDPKRFYRDALIKRLGLGQATKTKSKVMWGRKLNSSSNANSKAKSPSTPGLQNDFGIIGTDFTVPARINLIPPYGSFNEDVLFYNNLADTALTWLETIDLDRIAVRPFNLRAEKASDPSNFIESFAASSPDQFRKLLIVALRPYQGRCRGMVFYDMSRTSEKILYHACGDLCIPRILFVESENWYNRDSKEISNYIFDKVICAQTEYSFDPSDEETSNSVVEIIAEPRPFSPQRKGRQKSVEALSSVYGLLPEQPIVALVIDFAPLSDPARIEHLSNQIEALHKICESEYHKLIVKFISKKAPRSVTRKLPIHSDIFEVDYAETAVSTLEEIISIADYVLFTGSDTSKVSALGNSAHLFVRQKRQPEAAEQSALAEEGFATALRTAGWQDVVFPRGNSDAGRVQLARILSALPLPKTFERHSPLQAVWSRENRRTSTMATHTGRNAWDTSQKYVPEMLNIANRLQIGRKETALGAVAAADFFMQWGNTPHPSKVALNRLRRAMGRELLILEDGFIRSLDIGISGEPGLSIILDDKTSYYDATRPSRMETLLQTGPDLTAEQAERARRLIARIVQSKISKYNHAPVREVDFGQDFDRKILLVDQRFGDQSIESGLADAQTFVNMLEQAVGLPDAKIILKRHPDAIKGGKSSYFSNERVAHLVSKPNVQLIDYDINPFSLIEAVDEVWVATSGFGFEALMAGRPVRCFGAPYYSGWGVTQDEIDTGRRTRIRDISAIFHVAYLDLSRYFDPVNACAGELEDVISYIAANRVSEAHDATSE